MYTVRRVTNMTDEIAEEIRTLHLFCFGDKFDKDWDPADEGVHHHWWVAYNGKEVVGFAAIVPSVVVKDHVFLMRSGVLKEHRGHRLQWRMVRVRERYAKRLGFKGMVSYTIDNPHSANNLIRAGMTTYDPPWAFAGPTAIYWKKTWSE